jgi:hypothetical protein
MIKYYSQTTQNQRRVNLAKASSKKSAKSFMAKKSAKLPELSRAAVLVGSSRKISFVSKIKNYNFGLSAFILPKSVVKIEGFHF